MKVLILHPDFRDPGGVSSYYRKMKGNYKFPVEHYITGRRPGENGRFAQGVRLINDYAKFLIKVSRGDHDIVHVNPSLDPRSFLRDGVFVILARLFNKKTIVFFHGWIEEFEKKISGNGTRRFKYLYGNADAIIVLAEKFKKVLESWGCRQPIYREVIVMDDDIFNGFDLRQGIEDRLKSEKWRILFLSRVVREKGIYEAIESFSILVKKYPQIELIIAGDGKELENVKSFVKENGIPNIIFAGYVVGEDKYNLLKSSHVFFFPTYYGEGFPNTIVEAMTFGLPVVTRPVGGIADFFRNGEHGFATESKDPAVFADIMENLLNDRELYRRISLQNRQYAEENLLASQAASRLEKVYESVLGKGVKT
jgi:glycosyltransferase involved in cell wall biosynthesis